MDGQKRAAVHVKRHPDAQEMLDAPVRAPVPPDVIELVLKLSSFESMMNSAAAHPIIAMLVDLTVHTIKAPFPAQAPPARAFERFKNANRLFISGAGPDDAFPPLQHLDVFKSIFHKVPSNITELVVEPQGPLCHPMAAISAISIFTAVMRANLRSLHWRWPLQARADCNQLFKALQALTSLHVHFTPVLDWTWDPSLPQGLTSLTIKGPRSFVTQRKQQFEEQGPFDLLVRHKPLNTGALSLREPALTTHASLQHLHVSNTPLLNIAALRALSRLRSLRLDNCTAVALNNFGAHVHSTRLLPDDLSTLARLRHLTSLCINDLQVESQQAWGVLAGLTGLQRLGVGSIRVQTTEQAPALTSLVVAGQLALHLPGAGPPPPAAPQQQPNLWQPLGGGAMGGLFGAAPAAGFGVAAANQAGLAAEATEATGCLNMLLPALEELQCGCEAAGMPAGSSLGASLVGHEALVALTVSFCAKQEQGEWGCRHLASVPHLRRVALLQLRTKRVHDVVDGLVQCKALRSVRLGFAPKPQQQQQQPAAAGAIGHWGLNRDPSPSHSYELFDSKVLAQLGTGPCGDSLEELLVEPGSSDPNDCYGVADVCHLLAGGGGRRAQQQQQQQPGRRSVLGLKRCRLPLGWNVRKALGELRQVMRVAQAGGSWEQHEHQRREREELAAAQRSERQLVLASELPEGGWGVPQPPPEPQEEEETSVLSNAAAVELLSQLLGCTSLTLPEDYCLASSDVWALLAALPALRHLALGSICLQQAPPLPCLQSLTLAGHLLCCKQRPDTSSSSTSSSLFRQPDIPRPRPRAYAQRLSLMLPALQRLTCHMLSWDHVADSLGGHPALQHASIALSCTSPRDQPTLTGLDLQQLRSMCVTGVAVQCPNIILLSLAAGSGQLQELHVQLASPQQLRSGLAAAAADQATAYSYSRGYQNIRFSEAVWQDNMGPFGGVRRSATAAWDIGSSSSEASQSFNSYGSTLWRPCGFRPPPGAMAGAVGEAGTAAAAAEVEAQLSRAWAEYEFTPAALQAAARMGQLRSLVLDTRGSHSFGLQDVAALVAARGGLPAFDALHLPVAELSGHVELHLRGAEGRTAAEAAASSGGTSAAAGLAPASAADPQQPDETQAGPSTPSPQQAAAAVEHPLLDLLLLQDLAALHLPSTALTSVVMRMLAALPGLAHLHAGSIDARVPAGTALQLTSLLLEGDLRLGLLQQGEEDPAKPPSTPLVMPYPLPRGCKVAGRPGSRPAGSGAAAGVQRGVLASVLPLLQHLDCQPASVVALATQLAGHQQLSQLTTRTPASAPYEAWPASASAGQLLLGSLPRLAKVHLLGLGLATGADDLLADLAQCPALEKLHIWQRSGGGSSGGSLLAAVSRWWGAGCFSSSGLRALVAGPCSKALRELMIDTGGAYKLGSAEVLLDSSSASGLVGQLQLVVLPVTSCTAQRVSGRAVAQG